MKAYNNDRGNSSDRKKMRFRDRIRINLAGLNIVLSPEAIGDLLVKIAFCKTKTGNRLESGNRENDR